MVVGKLQKYVQRICSSELYGGSGSEKYLKIFCGKYIFDDTRFLFCFLSVVQTNTRLRYVQSSFLSAFDYIGGRLCHSFQKYDFDVRAVIYASG